MFSEETPQKRNSHETEIANEEACEKKRFVLGYVRTPNILMVGGRAVNEHSSHQKDGSFKKPMENEVGEGQFSKSEPGQKKYES